jgi:predicted PurR-regulated permease PerM
MMQELIEPRQTPRSNILFTVALLIALYAAYLVRDVLFMVYVSALFAVVLKPILNGIMQIRIRRWQPGPGIAILVLMLTIGGLLTVFFMFAVPPVLTDLREFMVELPAKGPVLLGRVQQLPLLRHVNLSGLNAKLQDFAANSASYAFAGVRSGAGSLADIATSIVLTIYFTLEGEQTYYWLLSFFEERPRDRLHRSLVLAEGRMGKWLLGQGSLMLILGVSSTITFLALHIRYAYLLGVLMGLFNLIPVVGAMISMALVIMVAAIDSWGRVLGVVIFYLVYVQVENGYLIPRIMRSSVDLPGLAVLIALLLGMSLAGVVGAMISVPTAVLVAVLINEYFVRTPRLVVERPIRGVKPKSKIVAP